MKQFFQKCAAVFRDHCQTFVSWLGLGTRREARQLRQRVELLESNQQRHEQRFQQQDQRFLLLEQQLASRSASLRWVVENLHGTPTIGRSSDAPLVSIVMPVWNREATVKAAIESILAQTYSNWELLVVDDGSEDHTVEVVSEFVDEPRIRILTGSHVGVCRARNRALGEARGEVIAYLDSDNIWFPQYLEEVAIAFEQHPEEDCVYAAQLVDHADGCEWSIRAITFDRQQFLEEGGIDLNAFAHRRRLVEEFGGFDEQLTRLVDWELTIRYTQHRAPRFLPIISGRYVEARADSISMGQSFARNKYLIQRRHLPTIQQPLRVLYAIWNYPQLTETYIRCEIATMRRWGVDIEVWSEEEHPKSPYVSEVPVHHGPLDEVLQRVRPDLVHVHWLNMGQNYKAAIERAGLKMTVRGHGYEFNTQSAKVLQDDATVQSVFLFPHFAEHVGSHAKLRPMTATFNGDWFYPPSAKNRRLVLRTGAGKQTKGLDLFLEAALRCPDHQFVLVLGLLPNLDDYVEKLLGKIRSLRSPVTVKFNLSNEESAALVREAGIYLHTYGDEEPFGMPVSIAEAMATGSLTLVRDLPGAAAYVGDAGVLYQTIGDVVQLIQNTLNWSNDDWRAVQQRTVESAYQRFADHTVLRPLLDDWSSIARDRCSVPFSVASPMTAKALDHNAALSRRSA